MTDKPQLYEPLDEAAAAYMDPGTIARIRRQKMAELERNRGLHLSFAPCAQCGNAEEVNLRSHTVNGVIMGLPVVAGEVRLARPGCRCGGERLAVFGPWPRTGRAALPIGSLRNTVTDINSIRSMS